MEWAELTEIPHRVFAQPIVELLRDNGIDARVQADDMGGLDPALAFVAGVRVLVKRAQLPEALLLLGQFEAAPEPDWESKI